MALSKAFTANALKLLKNETATKYEHLWAKLHTAATTDEGTTNAAAETTRKEMTIGAITEGDPSYVELSNVPKWTSVSTSETYAAISIWTEATGGTCLGSGTLEVSRTVSSGDTFELTGTKISIE